MKKFYVVLLGFIFTIAIVITGCGGTQSPTTSNGEFSKLSIITSAASSASSQTSQPEQSDTSSESSFSISSEVSQSSESAQTSQSVISSGENSSSISSDSQVSQSTISNSSSVSSESSVSSSSTQTSQSTSSSVSSESSVSSNSSQSSESIISSSSSSSTSSSSISSVSSSSSKRGEYTFSYRVIDNRQDLVSVKILVDGVEVDSLNAGEKFIVVVTALNIEYNPLSIVVVNGIEFLNVDKSGTNYYESHAEYQTPSMDCTGNIVVEIKVASFSPFI